MEIRTSIHVPSLPKNTHPARNAERRHARAKALHKRFEMSEGVVRMDSAEDDVRYAMAIAMVNLQSYLVTSGTVLTASPEIGEEAAVALAMTAPTQYKFIASDFKSDILNFVRGCVSSEAVKFS